MKQVTITDVENRIKEVQYIHTGRSVVAIVDLKCGHKIIGEAHCQPETIYSQETGEEESLKDAINKVFDLEIYFQRNKGREE